MSEMDDIPFFPVTRALTLADKPLLNGLFSALQPRMSELSFAGLYLFRQVHAYGLCRIGETPVILGKGYDGQAYALPPLAPESISIKMQLLAAGMTLYLPGRSPGEPGDEMLAAQYKADRDSFDYLYLREELASLPGKRFHKKKNRVNYFMHRHEHQVSLFAPDLRDRCLALVQDWERVRQPLTTNSLAQETAACTEALQFCDQLQLQGVVVTVQGQVVAFALGERLNRTTAVCHFEKADPFMEGASQLVNREFCRMLFTDCTYVNREQDLGDPGLREAKLSYHPVELVEKFRVTLKGAI